jgi:hypothetical protein
VQRRSTILSSYSFIGHYMFWPNWQSSGVQVFMVKDSAAHCNAIFFPPIAVASGYSGYVGYHQFHLGVLGLQVVAFGFVWFVGCGCGCLECSSWGGSSVMYWSAIIVSRIVKWRQEINVDRSCNHWYQQKSHMVLSIESFPTSFHP